MGVAPPEGAISQSEAVLLAKRGRGGNVRTLEHLTDRYVRWNRGAAMMGIEDFLAIVDAGDSQGEVTQPSWPDSGNVIAARAAVGKLGNLDGVLEQLKDAVIKKIIAECDGSLAEAERRLGWTHGRLQKRKQRSDSKQT
jgi:DNA-binding NtrC family response regulator